MKIILEIPDQLIGQYRGDKFKKSLEHVLFDAKGHRIIAGIDEWMLVEMLIEALQKSEVVDV